MEISSPGWRRDEAPPPISGLDIDTDIGMAKRGPRQIAPTGEDMWRDRVASAERYSGTRSTIRPVDFGDKPTWIPKAIAATVGIIVVLAAISAFLR